MNEQLKALTALIEGDNRGLTLAPEVARDDMREQIRKKIKNSDLFDGVRVAFANGYTHVKLYFLIGLPGERQGRSRRHRRYGRDDFADRQGSERSQYRR